jgi:cobalt-zinc-cadmium resistance protein CzcA
VFKSFKWALLILTSVRAGSGGRDIGTAVDGTNFSVSSGLGFLALFGVSVQTGVIMHLQS